MPQILIEAPTGVRPDAKQKMMSEISAAVDEAFQIPDVRVWLREYPAENVAQDGHIGAEPIRPLCFLEVPELSRLDAKRTMAQRIHDAIAEAYRGLANTDETLILMNHYPLENAGWAGRLQADNAEIVAAVRRING
jgi:hypothetical protein